MITFLRRLLIILFFLTGFLQAQANDYFEEKLKELNISQLETAEQNLVFKELKTYEKTLSPLYKTDLAEYKKKVNDLFHKLACGFKIYNLTAKNETLNKYIADFHSSTGINVYVISYVEGAFLNNLFQKLAELRFKIKQNGKVELKFRFTKVQGNEQDLLYKATCELMMDSTLLAKVKSELKQNYTTTASFDGNVDIKDADAKVAQKAEELLGMFKDFKFMAPNEVLVTKTVNYTKFASQPAKTDPLKNYPSFEIEVKWRKDALIHTGYTDNVTDWIYAIVNKYNPMDWGTFRSDYYDKYSKWVWDADKGELVKEGEKKTFYVDYGKAREVLAVSQSKDIITSFDNSILELSFVKEKKYTIDFVTKHYGKFECCLNEILRITFLMNTIDEVTWAKLEEKYKNDGLDLVTLTSFETYFNTLYTKLKNPDLEAQLTAILNCKTPGREPGQMTYLVKQLPAESYTTLTPALRAHIIKVMSQGEMSGKINVDAAEGEKDIVIKLLKNCTLPNESEQLLALLSKPVSKDNSQSIFASLVNKMDEFGGGYNFERMLGEVTRIIQTSAGFQASVSGIFTEDNINKRVVKWDFPQLTNKTISKYTGAIFISDIGYNEQTGKVTYRRDVLEKYYYKMRPELCMPEINPGCIKEDYDLVDLGTVSLDPMDLLVIIKHTDNSYGDESKNVKDEVLFVPAYYLYYYKSVEALEKKIRSVVIAIDLATISSGAGVFTEVAPMLRRAWISFRFLNAAGNITLNAANITDPTLRNVVLASDLVVGSIGFTELMMLSEKISLGKVLQLAVKTSGQTIETLKTNIKNFIETVERNQAALKAMGVKEASMGKIVEDLFVLKDAWKVKSKEMWNVDWGNIGKITKIINIEELVSSIRKNVLLKIKNNNTYALLLSNEELTELVNLGQKLKLTEDEIEAFVLAHCRRSQSASLNDMLIIMESITTKNLNNNIGWKPGWNMLKAYKEAQIKMAASQFLDPSEYLTSSYINNHLANFNNKASYFVNKYSYHTFVKGKVAVGIPSDNSLYISTFNKADEIEKIAGKDLVKYETVLGYSQGYFSNYDEIWRIDIKNPENFNLRIPSGNEVGANHWWHPGGYTSGGIIEAVTNRIPKTLNENKIITERNILE